MKNTFGNTLTVTLFGESHGSCIGAVLDGVSPGVDVDETYIMHELDRRRAKGETSTARHESDTPKIVSGVYGGKTTGTPITVIIENADTHSGDYESTRFLARPSHADYTAHVKYGGFEDYRGGGHFSARLTAAFVAAAGIVKCALEKKGITVVTHAARCAGVSDRSFENLQSDAYYLRTIPTDRFPVLDENAAERMRSKIIEAKENLDSVGGILETAILGVGAGLGEPWFDSVESELSHILFSIPAVKGVEFGLGFGFADKCASEANDPFYSDGNGGIFTRTNNNGGINGGITNGMPILFRTAVKPTPSIAKEQDTVNIETGENAKLSIHGRHDPCVVMRAAPVVDAAAALVIADFLLMREGEKALRVD